MSIGSSDLSAHNTKSDSTFTCVSVSGSSALSARCISASSTNSRCSTESAPFCTKKCNKPKASDGKAASSSGRYTRIACSSRKLRCSERLRSWSTFINNSVSRISSSWKPTCSKRLPKASLGGQVSKSWKLFIKKAITSIIWYSCLEQYVGSGRRRAGLFGR